MALLSNFSTLPPARAETSIFITAASTTTAPPPASGYVTEDHSAFYATEGGSAIYVPEI